MLLTFYMRDKVAGGEIHSVVLDLLSASVTMRDHDSPEVEDMMTFMTGYPSTCKAFYDLTNGSPLAACVSKDIYPGIVRVRCIAGWLGRLAPYYDNWEGKNTYLTQEQIAARIPCRDIARIAIEYLEKYNDPSFDAIMEDFLDDDWHDKHDLSARVGTTIFSMYDSTGQTDPIPNREERWTSEQARRYYAWCVASLADYLVRAVGWWVGVGRMKAGESKEVDEEIQNAFEQVRHLLESQLKYRRAHIKTPEEDWDPNTMLVIDLLSAAAKITQKYKQEL